MDIEEEICKEISKILEKDFYEINKIIVKNESISRGNFSLPCFKFANKFKENSCRTYKLIFNYVYMKNPSGIFII